VTCTLSPDAIIGIGNRIGNEYHRGSHLSPARSNETQTSLPVACPRLEITSQSLGLLALDERAEGDVNLSATASSLRQPEIPDAQPERHQCSDASEGGPGGCHAAKVLPPRPPLVKPVPTSGNIGQGCVVLGSVQSSATPSRPRYDPGVSGRAGSPGSRWGLSLRVHQRREDEG
jgi:hypothetical protein